MLLLRQVLHNQLQILQHVPISMPFALNIVKIFRLLNLNIITACASVLFRNTIISKKMIIVINYNHFSPLFTRNLHVPTIFLLLRSAKNELDDNIQIYVHIILEFAEQVTSRCNTSEALS